VRKVFISGCHPFKGIIVNECNKNISDSPSAYIENHPECLELGARHVARLKLAEPSGFDIKAIRICQQEKRSERGTDVQ
jgi:hypothetical protein